MSAKNTVNNYGSIAKWLHWGTAILFLGSYGSVYYREYFTEDMSPPNLAVFQLHLSIGITIAVVVLLRIIWRMTNPVPELEPGTKMEHLLARLGHYALYAIMIIMPITGYLGTPVNTDYFFMFEIPNFETTQLFQSFIQGEMGLTFDELEKPLDFIHKDIFGKWIVWILILGHASAALYHHFIKNDNTLRKMTIDK
jgi:cytochrome b561